MNRIRLYGIVLLACLTGLIWMWIQYPHHETQTVNKSDVCIIKQVTGLPCPSCGTTRSIFSLIDGDISNALHWNPFGLVVFSLMIISPIWILVDVLFGKETFLRWYGQVENLIRSRWIAIPAIGLVLANWIWNIAKGL